MFGLRFLLNLNVRFFKKLDELKFNQSSDRGEGSVEG